MVLRRPGTGNSKSRRGVIHDQHPVLVGRTTGESRWLVIGRIGGKHWSAVVTYRQDRIRIISVRRARDEEMAIYEV